MFAYVKSGSIVSYPQENRGIEIDGIKHSADIYTKWTESELNAINIYKVETDLSNFKKENYEFKDFATVTKSSLQLVEKAFKKKGKYSGVVSGFNDLDNMLGGLQNSDLIILAGRPSMGKTALATNIAFNAAKYYSNEKEKGSVVMFSLEMSAEQIGLRILAEQSRIPSDKLRKGELNERDSAALSSTYQEIHQLNFYLTY